MNSSNDLFELESEKDKLKNRLSDYYACKCYIKSVCVPYRKQVIK